jgi:hypothetical protein
MLAQPDRGPAAGQRPQRSQRSQDPHRPQAAGGARPVTSGRRAHHQDRAGDLQPALQPALRARQQRRGTAVRAVLMRGDRPPRPPPPGTQLGSGHDEGVHGLTAPPGVAPQRGDEGTGRVRGHHHGVDGIGPHVRHRRVQAGKVGAQLPRWPACLRWPRPAATDRAQVGRVEVEPAVGVPADQVGGHKQVAEAVHVYHRTPARPGGAPPQDGGPAPARVAHGPGD